MTNQKFCDTIKKNDNGDIMTTETIKIVLYSLLAIAAALNVIFTFILKRKNSGYKALKKESDYITETLPKTIDYLEAIFPNGNGIFKLDSVLQLFENYCLKNGIKFEKEKFTKIINLLVDLMNNKKEKKDE